MIIKKELKKLYIKSVNVFNKLLLKNNDSGMGVIEVILIIVVLIGLAIIFRDNITKIVNSLFNKITSKINTF